MMLETQKNMCDRAGCFGKKLCPQNLENGAKMGQKHVYEFIEKFGHYFQRICFTMETYIICCVSSQIPYLGKLLFLRYGPKCS